MPISLHPLFRDDRPDRLARFRADGALIARLRSSLGAARAQGDRLAEAFYERLFKRRPDLRPMFTTDPALQRRKLMDSLATIVAFLGDRPGLDAYLAELGRRHAALGVKPAHYEIVVETLVQALGDVLGDGLDTETAEDWRETLWLISEVMMRA